MELCAVCEERPVDESTPHAAFLGVCRECHKGRGSHLFSYRLYPCGSFSLGKVALDWILAHTADGDTILELGSGAATGWLAKRGRKMVSIEHNENYLGKHDSTYVYAPMVEYAPGRIWYDRASVARGIEGLDYAMFVVDGPVPRCNRFWLLDHLKLFDLAVPMLVDDVDCDIEDSVYGGLVAMSHRVGTRLYCGGHPERGIEGKWVGTIP